MYESLCVGTSLRRSDINTGNNHERNCHESSAHSHRCQHLRDSSRRKLCAPPHTRRIDIERRTRSHVRQLEALGYEGDFAGGKRPLTTAHVARPVPLGTGFARRLLIGKPGDGQVLMTVV
jgi:hypothetical protein